VWVLFRGRGILVSAAVCVGQVVSGDLVACEAKIDGG
jgi:hypothetical protein